ncbi:glycosyl hydrolase 53 family protein [Nonomuraea diastatica]|uniref:glycosyl hydrolase 53 family protein n=1 Tax=Nonomuraea diastatica TaxID=1848329 RepID=UPI003CCC5925
MWHGTLSHLSMVIADMRARYGKDVVIAETAYPFTADSTAAWSPPAARRTGSRRCRAQRVTPVRSGSSPGSRPGTRYPAAAGTRRISQTAVTSGTTRPSLTGPATSIPTSGGRRKPEGNRACRAPRPLPAGQGPWHRRREPVTSRWPAVQAAPNPCRPSRESAESPWVHLGQVAACSARRLVETRRSSSHLLMDLLSVPLATPAAAMQRAGSYHGSHRGLPPGARLVHRPRQRLEPGRHQLLRQRPGGPGRLQPERPHQPQHPLAALTTCATLLPPLAGGTSTRNRWRPARPAGLPLTGGTRQRTRPNPHRHSHPYTARSHP